MSDKDRPEPATHGQTVSVGEYELAPGAQLSQETQGPIGASEYTSFVVLDVDADEGTLVLCRMTDYERRTVTASNLASVVGVNTFVVDDGRDAADETDAEDANADADETDVEGANGGAEGSADTEDANADAEGRAPES